MYISPIGGIDNGADKASYFQMKHLVQQGYNVYNVILNDDEKVHTLYQKIGVKIISVYYTWWNYSEKTDTQRFQNYQAVEIIVDAIEKFQIDVIISNTFDMPQGAIAASLTDRPHIWLGHEFPIGDFEWLSDKYAFIKRYANIILCSSDVLAEFVTQKIGKQVNYVYPYSETTAITLISDSSDIEIINVDTLAPLKNQLELLVAFKQLKEKGFQGNLRFTASLSDSNYKVELLEEVEKMNLADSVFFNDGSKKNWEEINRKSIVVQTSRTETFGLTMIEALKLGIPLIAANTASKAMASLGYLKHDNIYEFGNTNHLVERLEYYLKNYDEVSQSFSKLRTRVIEEQSLEIITLPLIDAIENVVGESNPGSEFAEVKKLFVGGAILAQSVLNQQNELIKNEASQLKELQDNINEKQIQLSSQQNDLEQQKLTISTLEQQLDYLQKSFFHYCKWKIKLLLIKFNFKSN